MSAVYQNNRDSNGDLNVQIEPEDESMFQQDSKSIRFVSMIDSRPVQPPYLSLMPFKNFGNGDNVNTVFS